MKLNRKVAAAIAALASLIVGCRPNEENYESRRTEVLASTRHLVTPVRGPSWLKHLGLATSQTHMGLMGGTAGPPPLAARHEPELQNGLNSVMRRYLSIFRSDRQQAAQVLSESFTLGGADLYRLNCQSCHGPDGEGYPPEINSLLGPVQGSSAELIRKRMQEKGVPIDAAMAGQLASQAEAGLHDRLLKGGKEMPPFEHLGGDEVEALLGYLEELAGVPATKRANLLVPESAARVGEHVAKGTCHICHDATGPGGGHMSMMSGTIPSLASFPRDHSLSAVQRQVEYGSSGMMMMMRVQQMPALPFFTDEEVAALYFYLIDYPPQLK